MEQDNKQLSAMLVPLSWSHLLIPCSAIAELVGYQEPIAVENTPDWFLGNIMWRERDIPVVSFEQMSGKDMKSSTHDTLLLVLNRLTENGPYPFYALPVQGAPKNLRLTADDVQRQQKQEMPITHQSSRSGRR